MVTAAILTAGRCIGRPRVEVDDNSLADDGELTGWPCRGRERPPASALVAGLRAAGAHPVNASIKVVAS
jgi:hypothetical protein